MDNYMPGKSGKAGKFPITAIILIAIIIIAGVLITKKPSVTGKVVQNKETVFTDNLNLQVNESGTYEWKVKNPGSIKSIKATGFVSSNGTAKVYIEKNGTKQLLFDSTKQLFDINIHVLPEYKKIQQGGEVLVQITLLNVRGFGSGNVSVKYSIKDSKGDIIAAEQENIYVETQAKFVRKLVIPELIKPGTYVTFVEARTNVLVGSGSDTFEVMSKSQAPASQLKYYMMGIGAAAAVIILFTLGIYGFRTVRKKKEITEIQEKIPLEKAEKLEKELKALEEAHNSKFISDKSYIKEKERIENELGRLKNKDQQTM